MECKYFSKKIQIIFNSSTLQQPLWHTGLVLREAQKVPLYSATLKVIHIPTPIRRCGTARIATSLHLQFSLPQIERYGLENVSDPQTVEALERITRTMSANKFVDIGTAMGGTAPDMAKLTYLRAICEQNFIIIRQLDKLIK